MKDVMAIQERLAEEALEAYDAKEESIGVEIMRELERVVLMNITDTKWREHLYEMDYLQEGIHLRAYGQKDPLVEYQREAYTMFNELTESIRKDFVRYIYRVEFVQQDQPARAQRTQENRAEVESGVAAPANSGAAAQAVSDKVPRNAPCPCGSGKKYKKCHGAVA
jgi:preprotein translocase subunit SecA